MSEMRSKRDRKWAEPDPVKCENVSVDEGPGAGKNGGDEANNCAEKVWE